MAISTDDDRLVGFDIDTFVLTDDQRLAVEHDDGPMIVLAGPGTGKTRVITARVAQMISGRGIDPGQILAVTFTNKAAGELRDRLVDLIDSSSANRVNASTFHSFGLNILRRFGDVLGLPGSPMIIDSAQRNQLLRELIQEHKFYRFAIGRGISRGVELANGVMRELRNQGMSSADGLSWLKNERDGLGAHDHELAKARRAELDRFEQGVLVYEQFELGCIDRGWLMMDDLILLPTKILREHEMIASIIRQECRHVVVDEFQDVNRAQIELIRWLCPADDRMDLCVVGDDDQGIYGFRGADDQAFAHFARLYPQTKKVTLSTNFRSSEQIVSASNHIIDRAEVRFDDQKQAIAHSGIVEDSRVELVRLENDSQSGEVIASMILKMILESQDEFDLGTFAVIARTKGELEKIGRVLTIEGIPIDMREQPNPFDDEGVKDVLAWARLLSDPLLTIELKRVLVRPPNRCDPLKIGRLIQGWKTQYARWSMGDEEIGDPGGLIEWIQSKSDESISSRVGSMIELMGELGKIASEEKAANSIIEIVKRTGVAHSELNNGRERASRISSLVALIGFAKNREDRFEEPGDLSSMLRYWDDLDENEKSFGDLPEQTVEDTKDDSPGTELARVGVEGVRGAIAMVTAHASKGLEYDTVFIPRVSSPHGYPKNKGSDEGFIPDWLVDRGGDLRDEKSRRLDEERRVFYVALTRAEKRAVLIAKVPKSGKSINYVYELREELGDQLIERDVHDVIDPSVKGDALSRLGLMFKSTSKKRDVFDHAKRVARQEASIAMDAMEHGLIEFSEFQDKFKSAGDQMSLVRYVLKEGGLPDWVGQAGLNELGDSLVNALSADDLVVDEGGVYPGLQGPLKLSFSQLSKYMHCPRCYLVNYVLKLPQDQGVPMLLGTIVHESLELFYKRWRHADAEGEIKPGWGELERIARESFFRHWPRDEEVDEDRLEQSIGIVRGYWETMHDEDAHIEELEREHVFEYRVEGQEEMVHKIKAKIDRVDATSSGGRRVIDYKTGSARKDLIEPKKSDMQMGIYVMALEAELGDLGPGSVCEYWVLPDQVKGVIGIDALNMKMIRKNIDKAIIGILNGEWGRGSKCKGDSDCSVLEQLEQSIE